MIKFPQDAPPWLVTFYDELERKARRQVVKPDGAPPERVQGYFACVEDVREMIESQAEEEEAIRRKRIADAKKSMEAKEGHA